MYILRRKKQPFHEKLERATDQQYELLQQQIDSDPEMKRMLTSPMKSIPQYKWLYSTYTDPRIIKVIEDNSLFRILPVLNNASKLFFSKNGARFTGFLAYTEEGKTISDIKMASFLDDAKHSNRTIADDLINFIEKEIMSRESISWLADTKNSYANDQYSRALTKKKLIWDRIIDRSGAIWVYTVIGKEP